MSARLQVDNVDDAQEDAVFDAAAQGGFGWNVHRAHTIVGYAIVNARNMGVTLAVSATTCHEPVRPFRFPGSAEQWPDDRIHRFDAVRTA